MKKLPVAKVEGKKRFSGSMEPWLIEFVHEEAEKEGRSFSDMVGRLIADARWKRYPKGYDENKKQKPSTTNTKSK